MLNGKTVLRWVLVAPGAFAAAWFVGGIANLILSIMCVTNPAELDFKRAYTYGYLWYRLAQTAISNIVLVQVSRAIAPSHKRKVGIVVAWFVTAVSAGLVADWLYSGIHAGFLLREPHNSIDVLVITIGGSFTALYTARTMEMG